MNRTLTAAVALAAGLGLAGVAHAQSSNYESGGKPSAGQQMSPSPYTSPSTTAVAPSGPAAAPSPQQPNAPMPATPQANNMQGTRQGSMQRAEMQRGERGIRGGREHTTVAQVQQELKSQGLYNGAIDGVIGPQTKTALSQFQQQNGLRQTATLDRQTRDRLAQANTGNSNEQQPQSTQSPTSTPAPAPTTAPTTPGGTNNR
jgi:peptidoglycan hydrolase-like protein with peptidoglycan-binding domain